MCTPRKIDLLLSNAGSGEVLRICATEETLYPQCRCTSVGMVAAKVRGQTGTLGNSLQPGCHETVIRASQTARMLDLTVEPVLALMPSAVDTRASSHETHNGKLVALAVAVSVQLALESPTS